MKKAISPEELTLVTKEELELIDFYINEFNKKLEGINFFKDDPRTCVKSTLDPKRKQPVTHIICSLIVNQFCNQGWEEVECGIDSSGDKQYLILRLKHPTWPYKRIGSHEGAVGEL